MRISNHYSVGVGEYNPPPVEAPHLFDEGLNTLPVPMLMVITGQLVSHPASAYLLATFPVLADFTSGTAANEKGDRTNGDQYYHGERYQESEA